MEVDFHPYSEWGFWPTHIVSWKWVFTQTVSGDSDSHTLCHGSGFSPIHWVGILTRTHCVMGVGFHPHSEWGFWPAHIVSWQWVFTHTVRGDSNPHTLCHWSGFSPTQWVGILTNTHCVMAVGFHPHNEWGSWPTHTVSWKWTFTHTVSGDSDPHTLRHGSGFSPTQWVGILTHTHCVMEVDFHPYSECRFWPTHIVSWKWVFTHTVSADSDPHTLCHGSGFLPTQWVGILTHTLCVMEVGFHLHSEWGFWPTHIVSWKWVFTCALVGDPDTH